MSISAEEIQARLEPKHLQVADIKEDIAKTQEEAKTEAPKKDPRTERFYTFSIRHQGRDGKFTNRVLSIGDQQLVGVMRARLSGGVSFDLLDPYTKDLNLMVAHLTYSLTESPDWAKDLQKLDDVTVLQRIYEEVAAHEATFLGRILPEEASSRAVSE